jgi:hypothetical protein
LRLARRFVPETLNYLDQEERKLLWTCQYHLYIAPRAAHHNLHSKIRVPSLLPFTQTRAPIMKPPTKTENRKERPSSQYRMSVRIAAAILYSAFVFGGLELGLRLALPGPEASSLGSEKRLNTAEENRPDLPMYLPRQGGECVQQDKSKFHWNERFGFSSRTLAKGCVRKLFSSGKVRVVMLGGSTMANFGAVNYLTTLDYYAFGQHEDIVSINLAEPGARLWNMVARFMEEVTDLKPDVVLFLSGNEFAVSFGGQPGDDIHWTMGARKRVESPIMSLLDRALNQSRLAQVTLIETGIFPSSRYIPKSVDLGLVDEDVGYYLRTQESAEALCAYYQIKCLFILQPLAFLENAPTGSTEKIVRQYARYFPHDREIFSRGYELIRKVPGEHYLDASRLLENLPDAYIAPAHLSKVGNAALGKFFYSAVKKALNQPASTTLEK